MNRKDFIIRLEQKEDFRNVENLVRESFWNVYRPGCYEHYVIHVLREDPAFVKELDFVMWTKQMLKNLIHSFRLRKNLNYPGRYSERKHRGIKTCTANKSYDMQRN